MRASERAGIGGASERERKREGRERPGRETERQGSSGHNKGVLSTEVLSARGLQMATRRALVVGGLRSYWEYSEEICIIAKGMRVCHLGGT